MERVTGKLDIVAYGRQFSSSGRDRLFGFKAHFRGPVSDAVELYFFDDFYVGVNPVEGGLTNVCGLGSEAGLRRYYPVFSYHLPVSSALGGAPHDSRLRTACPPNGHVAFPDI